MGANGTRSVTDRLEFIYDEAGRPVQLIHNGVIYNYVLNLQGDVHQIRRASDGIIVAVYDYNAWGEVLFSSGWMAQHNPLRYRGKYFDNSTGLYYLQSRFYDPVVGRFINWDAMWVLGVEQGNLLQFNLFTYCLNNPANFEDPDGYLAQAIFKFVKKVMQAAARSATTRAGTTSAARAGTTTSAARAGTTTSAARAGTTTSAARAGMATTTPVRVSGSQVVFGSQAKPAATIQTQMSNRGWTEATVRQTVHNPHIMRPATNRTTTPSTPATAFFNRDGSHVIIDNHTRAVIQVSDRTRAWVPDSGIINPYIPIP